MKNIKKSNILRNMPLYRKNEILAIARICDCKECYCCKMSEYILRVKRKFSKYNS